MIKRVLFLLMLMPLCAFYTGGKFLNKIDLYQKDSYFKNEVYKQKDWKGFYEMKEPNTVIDPDRYDLHLMNAAIFFATNRLRETKGLKALKFSGALRDAAVVHSWQMVEKDFFNHYNTYNSTLRSPERRMKIFGVEAQASAENIDMNYFETASNSTYIQMAEKIVEDLYNSPPHRKNMMGKGYLYLGCAAVFEPREKDNARYIKATQDFSSN